MWRNGRRNGLKIVVLAISPLCAAYQISLNLPRKIARICKFLFCFRGRAEIWLILAQTLAHSRSGVSKIEARLSYVDDKTLLYLAEVLKVQVQELFPTPIAWQSNLRFHRET
jgi:transcriptional regulator with XRE-family HTH domain